MVSMRINVLLVLLVMYERNVNVATNSINSQILAAQVTTQGDAFIPIINLYRDTQNAATGMACRWYNMPPYANAIGTQVPSSVGFNQAGNGADLNYLTGLAAMLNRLYPESITGTSQTRPRVVVRVEEPATVRNRNLATGTVRPGANANRELDYYEPDAQYYYEEDGYAYDDYSDPDGYTDTVTYYDMSSANIRGASNVFQTWYGSNLNTPSIAGNTNACNVCATSSLLNLLMG
uniref:Uncharacterized protein n=1 Tax=Anopheles culicifacies TaxID=139723 RepID=A0A182M597_9DIPT